MRKYVAAAIVVVALAVLVPVVAGATHPCPAGSPPAHSEVATNPVTGGHIYTSGTNVGTHGNTGWIQVGTGGVQGSTSDGTTLAGSVNTQGVCIKVVGNQVSVP